MDQLRVVAIFKALSFVRKDLCQSDSMSFTTQWTIFLLSSDVLQDINDKICSTGYTTYKAKIKNVDAQESYKDGVIVLVIGNSETVGCWEHDESSLLSIHSWGMRKLLKNKDFFKSYQELDDFDTRPDFINDSHQMIGLSRYMRSGAFLSNTYLKHDVVDQEGTWKKKLKGQSHALFEILPKAIQEQLLIEIVPQGNVHLVWLLIDA
ncbi:hypothetical protein Tco_1047575 [Tanacetum coccineum]